jgi:uncharacterized membrane protein
MSWTHLHLALNHIPVLGAPFLLLMLAWGCWKRSRDLTRTALWWSMGFAALSIALKFTGDFAWGEAADRLRPVSEFVNAHEQSADQATTGVFLLGIASAVALFLGRKDRPTPNWSLGLVLAFGLATSLLMARAANLGGRINHPEVRPAGSSTTTPSR